LYSSKLKFGFRVDANATVGTGHLMELISLVGALKMKINFEPVFIISKDEFSEQRLRKAEISNIYNLNEDADEKSEINSILEIMNREECNILILNLLYKSKDYYEELHQSIDKTCVILDDGEFVNIPATLVINFSIMQNPDCYKGLGPLSLIGPEYVPLDESILSGNPIEIRNNVKKIFVNQGGGDPYGLTFKIVSALNKSHLRQAVCVLVGGAFRERYEEKLEHLKREEIYNCKFYSNISHDQVFDLMESADLAITAAGNTLYELAYFGIPSVVICHHEKHNDVAKAFEKHEAVINLGIGDRLNEDDIADTVTNIINDYDRRKYLSGNMKELVDGKGVQRVADKLLEVVF